MTTTYNNTTDAGAMVITDNGAGGLLQGGKAIAGSVDYGTGEIHIPNTALLTTIAQPDYAAHQIDSNSALGLFFAKKINVPPTEVSIVGASGTLTRIVNGETRDVAQNCDTGLQVYDVLQGKPAPCSVLLNSWVFDVGGVRTIERNGTLYQNWDALSGTGKVVGSLSLAGSLQLNGAPLQNQPEVRIVQGVYVAGDYQVKQFYGRTALAPVKPQSFIAYADHNGQTLTGNAGADERITGTLTGKIETATGFFELVAPEPIAPESLRYNAVSQSTVPINSREVGINPTRLPADGKVPIFRRGDYIVIGNKWVQDIGSAHTAGQVIQLQRQNNDRLCVIDANGKHVLADKYLDDLDAGTLTWQTPLDLSDYTMPLSVVQLWQEDNKVVDTDVAGSLKLQNPISRDYPLENTYVSSAVGGGDLICRATEPFTQVNWTGKWQNTADGNPAKTSLNTKDYPIVVTSDGTIDGRWRIVFRDANQIEVYEENMGLLWRGDILADIAPLNPATNKPYFTLPKQAFGMGGWEVGNVIRFNTEGTLMPVWILRVVQPHKLPRGQSQANRFSACLRGNTEVIE